MKIVIKKTLEFDDVKERKRLTENFNGKCRKRQLAILDAFCKKEFNKAIELYNALPYNDKDGCPEQEYVGLYFRDFFDEIEIVDWPTDTGFVKLQIPSISILDE